jgi:hypothetical protein
LIIIPLLSWGIYGALRSNIKYLFAIVGATGQDRTLLLCQSSNKYGGI